MTEPLLTEIDHVAIAVSDLDAAIAYYADTFGATVAHRERGRVRRGGRGAARRWPTATSSCSPRPARTRRWPSTWRRRARDSTTSATGWPTAPTALQSVKDHGGQVIDQAPRPGSRGTTVAFVHPKGAFGTLIELVQE